MASGSKLVIYAALAGNSAIAVTKFAAAAYTGSTAMLAEGIHSLADTGNQILMLLGLRNAKKPPSEDYPFGHGKEIYFWAFVVAMLLFTIGAGISIYEGIKHLLHPGEITSPVVNYVVLGLAIVFELAATFFAWREFIRTKGEAGYFEAVREGKDPTLFVVLFEDTAALLGLLVALLGIWLAQVSGWLYFDGIASILIGVILAVVAAWLGLETKGLLIGESAHGRVRQGVRDILLSHPHVQHLNELATLHMGPEYILLTLSVDFRDDLSVGEAEAAIAHLDQEIKTRFPNIKKVFIEVESRAALGEQTQPATP
jgi:cation diffusion facilitator family transporter